MDAGSRLAMHASSLRYLIKVAEFGSIRRAADALTAWYQRPDGDRPAAWAPEPEPDLGVPGPPQYIAGESGGRHLVGPDGQRYDIVGDWPARDSFFHALDDAAGRAGHPIAADPAGANGLRQQIADWVAAQAKASTPGTPAAQQPSGSGEGADGVDG